MVASPLLLLPRVVLVHGLFRHALCRRLLPDARHPDDTALVRVEICETALPAYFCTCGVYALFVDDALPDDPPPPDAAPPPPPENTPCPPNAPA
jgi:hypothetical protein